MKLYINEFLPNAYKNINWMIMLFPDKEAYGMYVEEDRTYLTSVSFNKNELDAGNFL